MHYDELKKLLNSLNFFLNNVGIQNTNVENAFKFWYYI